jgi:hypothetical protein
LDSLEILKSRPSSSKFSAGIKYTTSHAPRLHEHHGSDQWAWAYFTRVVWVPARFGVVPFSKSSTRHSRHLPSVMRFRRFCATIALCRSSASLNSDSSDIRATSAVTPPLERFKLGNGHTAPMLPSHTSHTSSKSNTPRRPTLSAVTGQVLT